MEIAPADMLARFEGVNVAAPMVRYSKRAFYGVVMIVPPELTYRPQCHSASLYHTTTRI